MGDYVLKHFGDKMRCQMRSADIVCRIGGDQFLMNLPDTGIADATHALFRMRQEIERADFKAELAGLKYSSSAGVAELRP